VPSLYFSFLLPAKLLSRLIPEDQTDEKQLREKFSAVTVCMASKIVQYWYAPLGLSRVYSKLAEGAAFMESDYTGDLRIYLRSGYEKEAYPYELAEQLRNFFNVPVEHRDLLTMALIAPEERVDELFEARGIAGLPDLGEVEEDEEDEDVASYAPILYCPKPGKKRRSRLGGDLRFSRLFNDRRFHHSFFNNEASKIPPSYNLAVARAIQNAIGRPVEPRSFGGVLRLKQSPSELDFVHTNGAVVATPKTPPTSLDRLKGMLQRDISIGERIVRCH
jgi:hypothetical protein